MRDSTKHDWQPCEFPGVLVLKNEFGSKCGYVAEPGLDPDAFPIAGHEDLHGILFTARRMGPNADVQLFADLERAKAWVQRGRGIHHQRDRKAAHDALMKATAEGWLYEAQRLSRLAVHERQRATEVTVTGLANRCFRKANEHARNARFAWDRWQFVRDFSVAR